MLKKVFGISFICGFIQLLVSCGGGSSATPAEVTLSSIALSVSNSSIPATFSQDFKAVGTYSDDTTNDISLDVEWSSSDSSIAIIDATGTITGMSAGTVTITATLGEISKTISFTVSSATLTSITITPSNGSIGVGKSKLFKATGIYSDSSSFDISNRVTWSSNDSTIVTIQSSGIASGVSVGTAIITAELESVNVSTLLDVTATTLSSITLSPSSTSIPNGTIQIFEATGIYENGSSQDISSSVTWTSSKTNIVSIQSSGIATGISEGSSIISATLDGISGTTTLTITAATLISISVTPISTSVFIDFKLSFLATGTYSNSSSKNISSLVAWTSSDTSKATVSSKGIATGISAGTVTITATLEGKSNSANLTVDSAATFQDVLNVINTNCSNCHGATTSNNAPMSLTSYSEIFLFANSISNRINASEGSNQLMPKDASKLSENEIAIIDSWIANGKLND